jgi:serine/threonine-protein kinase RsbT
MTTTTPEKILAPEQIPEQIPPVAPRPGARRDGPAGYVRPYRVEVRSSSDIVSARQRGRVLALELGFSGPDVTLIAAAISEVGRNIMEHAERGEIVFTEVFHGGRAGLTMVARDEGPGMRDAERMSDYGRGGRDGTGVGLPGVRLLMDEFEIESTIGRGTTVTMTKWLR